jgi:DNA-binding transcriptional ArsR family regulator/uncharacterized protein YndB with AHSA1/START domain
VWKALADPTRRRLLDLLRDRPRTTGELADRCAAMTRFAVMKHLEVLVDAGLVGVERRGRERYNHLDPVPLRRAYQRWLAPYAERAAVGEGIEGTEGTEGTALRRDDAAEGEGNDMDHSEQGSGQRPVGHVEVRAEVRVDAPPPKVFDTLLGIGDWWPHRFRDGSSVALEPWVGGRFMEDFADGSGALYGTVVLLDRPSALRVSGPMGMTGAVAGAWTVRCADDGEGGRATRVTLEHSAYGDVDEDTRTAYTEGWGEVLDLLATRSAQAPRR